MGAAARARVQQRHGGKHQRGAGGGRGGEALVEEHDSHQRGHHRLHGGHDGGPLPEEGIPIKTGKLRGVESQGMMCSIEEHRNSDVRSTEQVIPFLLPLEA